MSNDLTTIKEKAKNLRNYLGKSEVKQEFVNALPKWINVENFYRVIFTSTLKNPKILDCTMESILSSLIQCAELGLYPVLGRAHLIPYNNKKFINGNWQKVLECQFQPGYQGLVDLAKRSGEIADVDTDVVYENDFFDITKGTDRKITFRRLLRAKDRGEKLGVFVIWYFKNGSEHFDYMDMDEIEKIKSKSQSYRYAIDHPDNKAAQECPWIVWEDQQMKKSIIKRSANLVPVSIDLIKAVEIDNKDYDLSQISGGMSLTLPESDIKTKEEEFEKAKDKINKYLNKTFDGKGYDDLPYMDEFVETTANNQASDVTKTDVLNSIGDNNINSFVEAFKRYVIKKKKEKEPADITLGDDKEKEEKPEGEEKKNPFDEIDWSSSKMRAKSMNDFWKENKEHFESASEKSKNAFKEKWQRIKNSDIPEIETPDDSKKESEVSINYKIKDKLETMKERYPNYYEKAESMYGIPDDDGEAQAIIEFIDERIAVEEEPGSL